MDKNNNIPVYYEENLDEELQTARDEAAMKNKETFNSAVIAKLGED